MICFTIACNEFASCVVSTRDMLSRAGSKFTYLTLFMHLFQKEKSDIKAEHDFLLHACVLVCVLQSGADMQVQDEKLSTSNQCWKRTFFPWLAAKYVCMRVCLFRWVNSEGANLCI